MTSNQIRELNRSVTLLGAPESDFAARFYSALFAALPETRPMFGTDMTRQKARLMEMLSFLVEQIEHPEILEPMLSGLGKRHEAYGVKPDHYAPMGQVLLTEMALTLGEQWTPEVETAWKAAFQAIVDGMSAG